MFAVISCALCIAPTFARAVGPEISVVRPVAETDPVSSPDDAADDPAIWVHPTHPERSLILGTNKQRGLAAYDLAGRQVQFIEGGRPNNVDVRQGVRVGAVEIDLAATSDRAANTVNLYSIDRATGRIVPLGSPIETGLAEVYGLCLYRSARAGALSVFVNDKDGRVQQWLLLAGNGASELAPSLVRTLKLGTQPEGMAADDELGVLYVGEEDRGVWRFGAEPQAEGEGELVDEVRERGPLSADVEGIVVFSTGPGAGLLVVSSQGSGTFAAYRREAGNAYVGSFRVVDGPAADGVEETDGLDATGTPLGNSFPRGLFVMQDGANPGANQNFKLVHAPEVLDALGLDK